MSVDPPPVISRGVRIAAGLTGLLLVSLAISFGFMHDPGGAEISPVVGFLGFLLLLPALKAGPSARGVSMHELAVKYRRARILMWTCLSLGFGGEYFVSRNNPVDFRLVVAFMLVALAGFGFGGFSAYYLEQANQRSEEDDGAE